MYINILEELIKPALKPGQKFVSYKCKNLLPAGENYGSVMLQVKIQVVNNNGQEESINCVAKTTPPSEFLWEMFNTKATFKKEIAVYTTIVPSLNEFGKTKEIECLMNFLAKLLGARISLDPKSDVVDKDAVILLENLKVQGYDVGDRFNGFDLEATKFLLRDLAVMHAAAIAYKLSNPEEFEKKMLPHLKTEFNYQPKEDAMKEFITKIKSALAPNPKCLPYLQKIEEIVWNTKNVMAIPLKASEMFATITHNDFWVNNTMLKYENGKLVGNKIVDFQIMSYSSLANDVIFFLYSSTSLPVLENSVDELIKLYYENFIETLKRLQCDISHYTFDAMMEEFSLVAREVQLLHVLAMILPMMIMKGKATELSELNENSFMADESSLHENYYKRSQFVLLDFVKKGWI